MSLQQNIEIYGSKIGVPIVLRDTSAQKYCVDDAVVEPGKDLTQEQFRRITQLCDQFRTRNVLIRPTERCDWNGMVDVFRSPSCELSLPAINALIAEIREHCHLTWVQEYLAAERAMIGDATAYNPDNVHIQVVPKIREPWGVITEHPNYDDVYLIDVTGEEQCDVQPIDSYDVIQNDVQNRGGNMETFGLQDRLADLVRMVKDIRETGELCDETAHQFEFGIDPTTKQPLQFQIRDFASRNLYTNDPKSTKRSWDSSTRQFGTYDGSLIVQKAQIRSAATNNGEDGEQDYILAPESITAPLKYDLRFPAHMLGFVPNSWNHRQQSLIHQNTRFVQICLRRSGFAALTDRAYISLPDDKEVTQINCGNGELKMQQ